MVIHRDSGHIEHRHFYHLPDYLAGGDILVANDSRVIPARLYAHKETGGQLEILLLNEETSGTWTALVGGKRLRPGTRFTVDPPDSASLGEDSADSLPPLHGEIVAELTGPQRRLRFEQDIRQWLPLVGHTPLPPYITAPLSDAERYQTIYSRREGSAAAPTAGLHFSPEVLLALREQGVQLDYLTLHVGLDTFKPVSTESIEDHPIHSEWASLSPDTARRINDTKLAGHKLIAVGTTSMRVLETAALRSAGVDGSLQQVSDPNFQPPACPWRPVTAFEGATDLYIYPGFQFRAVDALITNFHLPKSSLLMLVGAYLGLELMHHAYQTAIEMDYRFYSFGDAMLIL
jgi:S-adenosylmethionine:tRNA ribosyltransferase-isomerase